MFLIILILVDLCYLRLPEVAYLRLPSPTSVYHRLPRFTSAYLVAYKFLPTSQYRAYLFLPRLTRRVRSAKRAAASRAAEQSTGHSSFA